ncbi:hypothetical protein A9W96_02365 [Mycobacterium sp. 1245852.3]|nr:hypothetical protein A9W96_02365 [Mycobacterium sp. 1245852.3]
MPDAACRGTTWLADLDVRASRESIDAAVEMCLGCPAMVACAEWVDGLPADQKPAGVTAARLFDPTAYQTARAVLVGELKPEPSKEAAKPRAPRRPARQLLAVAEAAGGDGVTVREAAVALHSSDVTSRQVEIARQGLERLVRRGALVRVDRDGRTRYAAAQLEVAS